MSISRRIATLFRVKANKALDRAEDPREVLDYSYEQQLEMVQKVRRGLADVATSRKRVELQVIQLQQRQHLRRDHTAVLRDQIRRRQERSRRFFGQLFCQVGKGMTFKHTAHACRDPYPLLEALDHTHGK